MNYFVAHCLIAVLSIQITTNKYTLSIPGRCSLKNPLSLQSESALAQNHLAFLQQLSVCDVNIRKIEGKQTSTYAPFGKHLIKLHVRDFSIYFAR